MKIHSFGINLDQGLPLSEGDEFEKLYVPFHKAQQDRLKKWVETGKSPIIVAGQIGTGKTTLINRVLSGVNEFAYISFKFDSKAVDTSLGGFLWHIISEIAIYCKKRQINLDEHTFLKDFLPHVSLSWDQIIELNKTQFKTIKNYERVRRIVRKLTIKQDFVVFNIVKIFERIGNEGNQSIILVFSGMDKFHRGSASYIAIRDLIDELRPFKLLLEFNAVHIFDQRWNHIEKLFLGTIEKEILIQLLNKRMGSYNYTVETVLEDLILYSGGNPRQSLKLLSNFLVKFKRGVSHGQALRESVIQTISDLFSTPNWPTPELMRFVRRYRKISSNTIDTIGDKDSAQLAIFGNWILLTGGWAEGLWELRINPLVNLFYEESFEPIDPTQEIVSRIANEHNMSSDGLISPEDWIGINNNILNPEVKLNFHQTWDILATSLLSLRRNDRTIVIYRSNDAKDITKSLMALRLELNGEIKFREHVINNKRPISEQLQILFSENIEQTTVHSIEFNFDLSEAELEKIDRLRDLFLPFKMIWWIEAELIHKFFVNWRSLRHLFNIVVLEDELKKLITIKEIQSDLELTSIIKNKSDGLRKSLQILREIVESHDE